MSKSSMLIVVSLLLIVLLGSFSLAYGNTTALNSTNATQYYVNVTTSSRNCGEIPNLTGYYAPGSKLMLDILPIRCTIGEFMFQNWTGSGPGNYTGRNKSANITVNGNITEVAAFYYNPTSTVNTSTSTTSVKTTSTITTTASSYYCPSFYWYNTTSGKCQPQTISSACPPNYPNSPTYYTCSGRGVSLSICPSGYSFNPTKSQCILNSGSPPPSTSNSFYNQSAQSASVAVKLGAELNNSNSTGYNFTANDFASNSSANCALSIISNCNNNEPDQFVCLNSAAYNNSYIAGRFAQELNLTGKICPQFLLVGTISCTTLNGYCVVTHSSYSAPLNQSNSSTNTTTIVSNSTLSTVTTSTISYSNAGQSLSNIISQIIQFFKGLLKSL